MSILKNIMFCTDGKISVRMSHKEIGVNTRNWIDLAQDGNYWRIFVNAEFNLRIPKATELLTFSIDLKVMF